MANVTKHPSAVRVGLTGGIASGKTLVAAMLQVCGAPVAFADEMARGLMETPGTVRQQLRELLGASAYTPAGTLDREAVGARLFGDPDLLAAVNAIVHPAVGRAAEAWHARVSPKASYTVYESALLFESGAAASFDLVVHAYAPLDLRLARAMARGNLSREDAAARAEAQWTDQQRLAEDAYVIVNDGSAAVIPQVHALHRALVDRGT